MKASPLIINWHDDSNPIYSCHFEPTGRGRLATAGGDNNIRLWQVDSDAEDRKVEYLSTLSKHTQSVNCVRWAPRGDLLASASDDGNVILWVPDVHSRPPAFGEADLENKESWRVKHMCRSSGEGIYDLAWSPDSVYFITGSMDNIARIYSAQTAQCVRQIAEHSHYIQGVAWDPLNEYVATQSSDRSVHIYTLRTKDGHYTLDATQLGRDTPSAVAKHQKLDFPNRRISSNSPAPPEIRHRPSDADSVVDAASPAPSAPGTPASLALPMNPPSTISHSRRSSFGNIGASPIIRRSASPAPSMPLPAVMPMEPSPRPFLSMLGSKNGNMYANETLTSFFRRLTFTPDGALLLTPAGQYQTEQTGPDGKKIYDVINTVYIYTRGGINKAPIAHLPGHKKPSVAVKCSPILYCIRKNVPPTKHITIDTSDRDAIPSLPEPVHDLSPKMQATSIMDPPSLVSTDSGENNAALTSTEAESNRNLPSLFALPYRMVYAVATQDSVLLYDTQQNTPLCIVSNLHYATFTDLTWSSDGTTLLMSSSDGFCSTLCFTENELGTTYTPDPSQRPPTPLAQSIQSTPGLTPPTTSHSPFPRHARSNSGHSISGLHAPSSSHNPSPASFTNPNSSAFAPLRPSSPARSDSMSSIATQASIAHHAQAGTVLSNPPLMGGAVPALAQPSSGSSLGCAKSPNPYLSGLGNSGQLGHGASQNTSGSIGPPGVVFGANPGGQTPSSSFGRMDMTTPPQTPHSAASSVSGIGAGVKREREQGGGPASTSAAAAVGEATASESEIDNGKRDKRRRIAPTPVERP